MKYPRSLALEVAGMIMNAFLRMVQRIFSPKPERVGFKLATYREAEALLKQGWTLAPEEDFNHTIGIVYLERFETANKQ